MRKKLMTGICTLAMVLALGYGAFDALVCVFVIHSLLLKYCFSYATNIAFNSIYKTENYIHA